MTSTYTDFVPTHEITLEDERDGTREAFDVSLVDGAAYTREEWAATAKADWGRDDKGHWSFQGDTTPAPHLTVSVRALAECERKPGDSTTEIAADPPTTGATP